MHSVNNIHDSCIKCTQSTTIKAAASNALSQQQSRQLYSMHSVNNNQDSCIQCTQSTTIKTAAFNALGQQQSRQLHSMHLVNNNQGSCIQCTQSTTIKTAAFKALGQQQSRQLHSKHSVNNNQDSCIQCTRSTTIKTAAFKAISQHNQDSCIQCTRSTTIKTAAFKALGQQQSRQLHSMHSVNNNQDSCIQSTQSTTIKTAAFNATVNNNQGSCIQSTQSTTIKTASFNTLSQQQSRQLHSKHSVNDNQDSCIQSIQPTTIKTAAFNALSSFLYITLHKAIPLTILCYGKHIRQVEHNAKHPSKHPTWLPLDAYSTIISFRLGRQCFKSTLLILNEIRFHCLANPTNDQMSHSRITAQLAGFHGENTQGCLGLHCLNPMMFAMHQAGKLSMCCAALTFDQHLYLKAYRIKDENRHEFQNMTLWLGHFHKLMSFLRSGCKLMEGSGLEYMWQLSIPET